MKIWMFVSIDLHWKTCSSYKGLIAPNYDKPKFNFKHLNRNGKRQWHCTENMQRPKNNWMPIALLFYNKRNEFAAYNANWMPIKPSKKNKRFQSKRPNVTWQNSRYVPAQMVYLPMRKL